MDRRFERIRAVLGKDANCTYKTALRFLDHLSKHLALPCQLAAAGVFPWEDAYIEKGWDDPQYLALKADRPAFGDLFDLQELLPPEKGQVDILADVIRCSDGKSFRIPLSQLECTEFKSPNYPLLDDYRAWQGKS